MKLYVGDDGKLMYENREVISIQGCDETSIWSFLFPFVKVYGMPDSEFPRLLEAVESIGAVYIETIKGDMVGGNEEPEWQCNIQLIYIPLDCKLPFFAAGKYIFDSIECEDVYYIDHVQAWYSFNCTDEDIID